MADEYSLLDKFASQLSRHLFFHLLDFETGKAVDAGDEAREREVLEAKIKLLEGTNMSDYVAALYEQLHGTAPPAKYAQQREAVIAQMEKLAAETEKISELLVTDEVVNNLRSDKVANLAFLEKEHGVTNDMVDALYHFGQFQFRCGDYQSAADLLYKFRVLSTDNDKVANATWGKLASDILTANWESAVEELVKVKESIDSRLFNNPRAQLDQRTMLVHWALFPLFNHEPARDTVLDLLLSANFINTVQIACPWILRYIAVAVVTGRGRTRNSGAHQKQVKDLVRYIRQEEYEYKDPITEFVSSLFISFEFDEAPQALARAETLCRNDMFLSESTDLFLDAARHLICESYCKICCRFYIRDLSEKLGLNPDEGEKWIVNLIRDTRLDAKIDAQQGVVTINHPPSNVHQQVVEKTKGVFFRTTVMSTAVGKGM
ncbi:probable Int-6 protein [Cephalotrichum gorgonifer]|uniref:Eukaryotic translation initiation factor 3 subunit E n=1 Tax=Cephalotrichum gorgonifer TaxID=2041049 RepID=A0AAE8SSW4_9PEZI|nr:probable Int-6 protein [Cephalotrichum gorgonifer]